ncbi:MAG: hypothetical protein ICV62_18280 [Cyanobacteria bacterium Co-bin13]|nr:hypothetical protein [Cyanobacteria bacterium Co-bin13]
MDQLIQLTALVIVRLGQFIQPFLVPLCFVTAWLFVVLTIWNLVSAAREGITQAKQMHQIPCADCRYFTNSHFLKCPINPMMALSEEAINCSDFEAAKPLSKVKDVSRA